MEKELLRRLLEKVDRGEKAVLATVLEVGKSSPARSGSMMVIFEDNSTIGTVGGGSIEHSVIKESVECIKTGESKILEFNLGEDEKSAEMYCGGESKIFLKTFIQKDKLVLLGSGHVANEVYKVARNLNYDIHIFDNRPELCNTDRFPGAALHLGEMKAEIENFNIDKNTYIVIAGPNHQVDEESISMVLSSGARYIGMLGSNRKYSAIKKNLIEKGFKEEDFKRVKCPIGIDIGSSLPSELAIGIMAEISIEKNNKF